MVKVRVLAPRARFWPAACALIMSELIATEADKDALRTTGMYRNYYSARAAAVVGSVSQSNLLNKPRVLGVLHGGGLIFLDGTDPNLKLMEYWITHPMPKSGDEFSDSSGMFTTGVPGPTACRDQ